MVLALGDREHLGDVVEIRDTRGAQRNRLGPVPRSAARPRFAKGRDASPQHRVYGFLEGLLASRLKPLQLNCHVGIQGEGRAHTSRHRAVMS